MKNLFILVFLSISTTIFSQQLCEKDFIGSWKVTLVEGEFKQITGEKEEDINKLKASLLKSIFNFKEDNMFSYNIHLANEINDLTRNLHWEYNPNDQRITVHEWKHKDNPNRIILSMVVKHDGERTIFQFDEFPFMLQIEKVNSPIISNNNKGLELK